MIICNAEKLKTYFLRLMQQTLQHIPELLVILYTLRFPRLLWYYLINHDNARLLKHTTTCGLE